MVHSYSLKQFQSWKNENEICRSFIPCLKDFFRRILQSLPFLFLYSFKIFSRSLNFRSLCQKKKTGNKLKLVKVIFFLNERYFFESHPFKRLFLSFQHFHINLNIFFRFYFDHFDSFLFNSIVSYSMWWFFIHFNNSFLSNSILLVHRYTFCCRSFKHWKHFIFSVFFEFLRHFLPCFDNLGE